MRHDRQFSFNTLPLHFGKVLTGTEGGASRPADDIPRYLRMIRAGRFDPRGMVTHRCSLPDINEAIAAMRAGQSVHTIIRLLMPPPASSRRASVFILSVSSEIGEQLALAYLHDGATVSGTHRGPANIGAADR